MSCFSHDENRVKARELLIARIKERIPETPMVLMDLLIQPVAEGETWEQMAKRRKTEKQAKVTRCTQVQCTHYCSVEDHGLGCFTMPYLPLF